MGKESLYRQIPAVDRLLEDPGLAGCPHRLLLEVVRSELEALRAAIASGSVELVNRKALVELIRRRCEERTEPSLRPVVNATGVMLHTNLGRAPIDEALFEEARAIATGYSNLEYDLEKGCRGDRYIHTARALSELLGSEDALIVNNNAAAVFLILNTFAAEREVVVSRGELVEIGGSFRIPEVMAASGAKLREVGATNKTHLYDYERAIGEETAMLMKVHKSNYRIEGFGEEVEMERISTLARERGLLDYYDLGSAYWPELPWGLGVGEPPLPKRMKRPPSLLSFSGDKLFGGVQSGIIVGKREHIFRLKRNQILRMFRVDKLTLALLERTVLAYREGAYERIPVLKMLNASLEELQERGRRLQTMLGVDSEMVESSTFVGGGTMPGKRVPTVTLALEGDPEVLESHFRGQRIIGRIENEHFVLDLRTVREEELELIARAAKELAG